MFCHSLIWEEQHLEDLLFCIAEQSAYTMVNHNILIALLQCYF